MFSTVETMLLSLVHTLPLELFVFIASFIEEVFAPIPSLAVLLVTGSFAALQHRTLMGLLPLAIIAALGKTIGAIIVYYFAEKIGGVIVTKFGRFFDITPDTITNFSSKITGTPKDYLLLTLFRSLPILPSSVVSVTCGLLKIRPSIYLITTFVGTIVRDSIFLYVGFTGTKIFETWATRSADVESLVQMILLLCALCGLLYLYFRRKKSIS